MYTTRVLDAVAQFNSLEERWNTLLAQSNNPTIFNTWAWASCWLQVYWRQDYTLNIIVVETHGALVAVLPLYIQHNTHTCWFVGSGEPEAEEVASEYLDFIVHQQYAGSAELNACINTVLESLGKYRLELVNCQASSYVVSVLRDHRRAMFTVCGNVYKLAVQGSFTDTAMTFSKNQFKNARQCLNRFNAAPELEYVAFHNNTYTHDWHTLQTLHQQDWTSRGKDGAFHAARFSRFHALMHAQQPQLKQAFVALTQKGATLAIHHFYVFGQQYYFYLAGTDKQRESRLSPGLMLHVLALQELSGQGATYDFLKGGTNSSYKAKFCGTGDAFYDITVFETSWRGHLRHWLVRQKRKFAALRKSAGMDDSGK